MNMKIRSAATALALMLGAYSAGVCRAAENEYIEYTFSGFEAEMPGYAEGTVTVHHKGGGICSLYWADKNGALEEYEKITDIDMSNGSDAVYNVPENMAIPKGAEYIAAFITEDGDEKPQGTKDLLLFEIPAEKRFSGTVPEMTFASVSDVHVNYNSSDPNSDNYCGAPYKWTQALNYFANVGTDMVIISGDCTSAGGVSDYETYTRCIAESDYDADKVYMARGNHDSQQNANFISYTSHDDMIRPFEDSPWFYVLKKGEDGAKDNLFIFLAQELNSISSTNQQDNFSSAQLDWLENLLKQYSGTNTNIFITEHAFYHNWGPGDRYNGVYVQPMLLRDAYAGNMRLQRLLIEYKEAVFMTGHSHIAFSEMVNYSDEHNTACRMIHNSSTSQLRVYTQSGTIRYRAEGVDDLHGSEGYVAEIYENDIVYNGTNLTTHERIPTACYIFASYTEDRSRAKSISVSKMPDKTLYDEGAFFDPRGMEITAVLDDGTSETVRGWGLKTNGELSKNTTGVTVVYGGLETTVPIRIKTIADEFEGDGTKASPYLIQTPADFMRLTKCFALTVGTSSNDNNTFGKGKYFLQTADIDMRGYPEYAGTPASGSAKYGFSGIYNGGGHTITAEVVSSGSDVSVFPYVNGVVCNVNFEGSLSARTYAQPIRTIGKNGSIINCSSRMTLGSDNTNGAVNGLALSNYGNVARYYSQCVLNGKTNRVYCNTNSGCVYSGCMYSGSVSDANGERITDMTAAAMVMNTLNGDSTKKALEILKKYDASAVLEDICLWHEDMSVGETLHSAAGGIGMLSDDDGEGIKRVIANYSDTPADVCIYAAVFDGSGRLTAVGSEAYTLEGGAAEVFGYRAGSDDAALQTYLWNKQMMPYFE